MIKIPVSVGELIDKLSILHVKQLKISNEEKLEYVNKEFELLYNISSYYLNNQEIETLWRDPILRYSNILDGIFHSKVVICESDSDCRFYGAVYDAICESNSDNILKEDIMFIHCGGKDRLPVVAKSLHKLKVPISIICDFDVLNNETTVKSIYESVGGNWEEIKEYFKPGFT